VVSVAGSLLTKYRYDTLGRLVETEQGGQFRKFKYDSLGRLTRQKLAEQSATLNDAGTFVGVGGSGAAWSEAFAYDNRSNLTQKTDARGVRTNFYVEFNHPDRLGTRVITNQQTGSSSEQAHLPFGTALNAESSLMNNNKRFTSYDRSAQTGLDYAVNRTYDSKQGRFTQVDPIGMQAASLASPQTLNLYTYCGNDPINYTDPSGLFFGRLFKWIKKSHQMVNDSRCRRRRNFNSCWYSFRCRRLGGLH
jgi:RHS repeat-associated protein